jgi:hypothetical protein
VVRLLMIIALLLCVGCSPSLPQLRCLPDQPRPVPSNDLPREMRVTNWIGVGVDDMEGGSCVHASTINTFRGIGRPDLEKRWYNARKYGYEGPETGNGILSKFKEQRIPYYYTDSADSSLLEAASDTHRPGIIFYYPSHCVSFQEFAVIDGREYAVLLDNNYPDEYKLIERGLFEKSWRYYDGFAAFPWLEPMTPRTYPRTVKVD